MYFLVETKDQLNNIKIEDECFLQVIPSSYIYHPALSYASLYYYRNKSKGYIIAHKHSECFSIDNESIKDFFKKHKRLYVLDKKFHSYFLNTSNMIDVFFSVLNREGSVNHKDFKTNLQLNFEKDFESKKEVNEIIPVCKHYEHMESLYEYYKDYFTIEDEEKTLSRVIDAYEYVEKNPIKVKSEFFDLHNVKHPETFSCENLVYNKYNLYNQTGRPTNSFNGVNFLAIPKEEVYRKYIIAKENYLVEYDFDGYHVRLIAKEIGYNLPKDSVHEYLGKKYFNKSELTEEDYKNSKITTFKQLYGGVYPEYKDIEFFKLIEDFASQLEVKLNKQGVLKLPSGIILNKSKELTKYKIFNYYIQNLETVNNTDKILKIKNILSNKITRLVLITYDAFLFDYALDDGKELLLNIKNILEDGGYPTKHKHGKNYLL